MALVEFKDGRPVEGALDSVEVVEIPEGVVEIADSAFEGQTKIREIIIPDSVKRIGKCAFRHCDSLEKLYIPDSVEKIAYSAFGDCKSLQEIVIDGETTALGSYVFRHCDSLKKVILPKFMTKIPTGTFFKCTKLEHINIPESVWDIGAFGFQGCVSVKEAIIPTKAKRIGSDAFNGCTDLEVVKLPDDVQIIDRAAFGNCKNLKRIVFPEHLPEIAENAFDGIPDDAIVEYKGQEILKKHLDFTDDLTDGLGFIPRLNVLIAQGEILKDKSFSPILVTKLANAEHSDKLAGAVEKYQKSFQTIGFYDIDDKIDVDAKEHLIQLFKNNTSSCGVVPHIIDALTIASTTLNIQPEQIVKSFEDKKFRDAIIAMRTCHEGNHFFDCEAALFAMTFDVNMIKQFILENPYKDYASVLLCKGYKTGDEKFLNLARWIAKHPDSNREIIEKLYKYQDYVDILPDMTADQTHVQVSCGEGELEIRRIEDEYDGKFNFQNCVCNLPKTEVELGKYRAYIMDAQDPRQVMLGYDTNCCQHLGGAGETAMMYGLANPNAGFFVIEDKETGKILAQAETWEYEPEQRVDDKTLVFDNIEFANDRQIDQFAPILGRWCEASAYHNIIMGDGYNAMDNGKINHTDAVEPPVDGKMVWLMDKDSIIDSSKDMLSDQYPSSDLIYEAIASKELNLEDYGIYGSDDCCISSDDFLPYTDADESCSVLKSDGKVEPYFKDALEEYLSMQQGKEQAASEKHKSRGR
ncbi:leucine-rich repeat domain-containing protein [Lacrimispora indolis]|uniref:leucine-rich repeat domain-containing protein n=1 Tax=Lacrimispora indolis TaxID=69825 RepID=UPI003569779C